MISDETIERIHAGMKDAKEQTAKNYAIYVENWRPELERLGLI